MTSAALTNFLFILLLICTLDVTDKIKVTPSTTHDPIVDIKVLDRLNPDQYRLGILDMSGGVIDLSEKRGILNILYTYNGGVQSAHYELNYEDITLINSTNGYAPTVTVSPPYIIIDHSDIITYTLDIKKE